MMSQTMFRRVLYGSTVFSSALLLFLIQPMMAKAILPVFGGAAGVWTSAMVFFQVTLLLGYAFAHWTTEHLRPRRRSGLYLLLLAVSLVMLPVMPSASWKPAGDAEPVARILILLTLSVGLPYLLLCATGPLAQAWYAG